MVDFTDLVEDPGADFGMVITGVEDLTPYVGEAADGGDFKMQVLAALEEGLVAFKAITLEEAFERVSSFGVNEDVVEAGV